MSRIYSVGSTLLVLCGFGFWLSLAPADAPQQTARGRVFHDVNGNGKWDTSDEPLAGVGVSNGHDIVETRDDGTYQISVGDDTILFVIKPRNFQVPLNDENLPQFYYIHKPQGSPPSQYAGVSPTGPLPESVDFPLYPQDEADAFRAIFFGDPQPRNQQEVDWIAHDIIEPLIGTDASFGVTLGDIAFNDLNTMHPLNQTIALLGIPWYNVAGNHDINMDATSRRYANETFERIYGPSYYSFDHGPVHFIVTDDIDWYVADGTTKHRYRGGLGEEQMEFIRRDLERIPPDQMVVLMMHIPLTDVHDRQDLYRLIEKRPFCISISGHTHYHKHVWITDQDGWQGPKPHHHIINVTVCGSWWSGALDERGIPHTAMADGAPNGYSIMTFDGVDYHLDYFAAGRSPDYQMEIQAPDEVQQGDADKSFVYVNVFNGSERSHVEFRIADGEWTTMSQVNEVDPNFQQTYDREAAILEGTPAFRKLPRPRASGHLWKAALPAEIPLGTQRIAIRAMDYRGRELTGNRVIRVVP